MYARRVSPRNWGIVLRGRRDNPPAPPPRVGSVASQLSTGVGQAFLARQNRSDLPCRVPRTAPSSVNTRTGTNPQSVHTTPEYLVGLHHYTDSSSVTGSHMLNFRPARFSLEGNLLSVGTVKMTVNAGPEEMFNTITLHFAAMSSMNYLLIFNRTCFLRVN